MSVTKQAKVRVYGGRNPTTIKSLFAVLYIWRVLCVCHLWLKCRPTRKGGKWTKSIFLTVLSTGDL